MATNILGIGTALPDHSLSQSDSLLFVNQYCCDSQQQERTLRQLYKRTQISRRYTVLQTFFPPRATESDVGPSTAARMRYFQESAGSLAVRSCNAALTNSGMKAESITHLVTISCTGFASPGVDLHLVKELNLPATVARTNVGFMGCHGALNGLRVARAFCESEPDAIVLLCATELCSIHFQYGWDHDNVVASSLFADGSGAAVLSGRMGCDSPQYSAFGSCVLPDSEAAMTWYVGDHGFTMTLASEVPSLIEAYLPGFIHGWLLANNLLVGDVKSWAVHPGGPKILDAVQAGLHLDDADLETSRAVLWEFGNMSSPTILFILERMHRAAKPKPWVALAFGPGLTIEAALIR